MSFKVSKLQIETFLISFGFLFLPFYMRSVFLSSNLAWFNFISAAGVLFFFNHKYIVKLSVRPIWVGLIYMVLTVLYLYSYIEFKDDYLYALSLWVSWVSPLILLFESVQNQAAYIDIFKCWKVVINTMTYLITICFVFDKVFGIGFSEFFRNLYGGGKASAVQQ